MAAIKAAQLGLKVGISLVSENLLINSIVDGLYRETWFTRGNVLERWMYPVEGDAQ